MALNDSEILVMQTIVMKFNETEALAWIRTHQKKKTKPMSVATYYRTKARLKTMKEKRKYELQKNGLWEQHLERIDQLETIMRFSWQNYHRATTAMEKQRILDSIAGIQPLLSTYYSVSQEVIEADAQKGVPDSRFISELPKGTK